MNAARLKIMRDACVKAAVLLDDRPIPEWRFDGKEIRTAEEVAVAMGIPLIEAKEYLAQKGVYTSSGSGVTMVGVGTRTHREAIYQRANALAYGHRRKRRHKRRSEK